MYLCCYNGNQPTVWSVMYLCCYNGNQPTVWSVMYLCVVVMVINLQYGL